MNIDDRPTTDRPTSHFGKFQMAITLQRVNRLTCMYTDHTLPSDTIMTVDAYHRRLDIYFARLC